MAVVVVVVQLVVVVLVVVVVVGVVRQQQPQQLLLHCSSRSSSTRCLKKAKTYLRIARTNYSVQHLQCQLSLHAVAMQKSTLQIACLSKLYWFVK